MGSGWDTVVVDDSKALRHPVDQRDEPAVEAELHAFEAVELAGQVQRPPARAVPALKGLPQLGANTVDARSAAVGGLDVGEQSRPLGGVDALRDRPDELLQAKRIHRCPPGRNSGHAHRRSAGPRPEAPKDSVVDMSRAPWADTAKPGRRQPCRSPGPQLWRSVPPAVVWHAGQPRTGPPEAGSSPAAIVCGRTRFGG